MKEFIRTQLKVEAYQYKGQDGEGIIRNQNGVGHFCRTMTGDLHVELGDWIVHSFNGDYHVCKPDIFALMYKEVE